MLALFDLTGVAEVLTALLAQFCLQDFDEQWDSYLVNVVLVSLVMKNVRVKLAALALVLAYAAYRRYRRPSGRGKSKGD